MSRDLLTIGEVARRTGRATSSLRYYEEIGLLVPACRVNGRRRYDEDAIRTLAVVATAQRGGLNLDEIRLLLEASPSDRRSTERLRDVAERKLPEVVAMIERAELVRGWLECASRCECPSLEECPLFDEQAAGRPEPPRSRS